VCGQCFPACSAHEDLSNLRQADAGVLLLALVVKQGGVLDAIETEAGTRYEGTDLAKRAVRARGRVALVLLAGIAALLLEALLQSAAGWIVGAGALGLVAYGVRAGRLGGVVAAALVATLAVALPLRLLFIGDGGAVEYVTSAVSVAFGIALMPDLVGAAPMSAPAGAHRLTIPPGIQ
jgi:hypothetical protein